ncbi:nuclear receptor subfamily 0 group B member 2a [Anguilla anguilla]|uniref:nuclear receptor subfamily 0 group B member 2a n=1 Tax=Anguilla anguilla TaxID=7936 RepID=UPI0015B1F814|nr:nuclear receptor subfamily 0 group B member 2a [Anguilla anguilla]
MSYTEMTTGCQCSDYRSQKPNAILFNILSQTQRPSLNYSSAPPHSCHCQMLRTVRLTTPGDTCPVASGVLVKTVRFMQSLLSFRQLPARDQLALLRGCWAPVFLLGLAQEGVDFQVTDAPAASMLKRILLEGQEPRGPEGAESERAESDQARPTLAAMQKLKSCLHKFWSLDLTPKEYAYLKGAVLFDPDVPQLKSAAFIEGLQREAERALREVLTPLHPQDKGRFSRILLTASTLKSINPNFVIELFFRPVIGPADLFELLVEMLFSC